MHPKIREWLDKPVGKDDKKVLEYLAELIAVNGGSMNVTTIGTVKPKNNAWKREGLTPQEGIFLVKLQAFLSGMLEIVPHDNSAQEVSELIQAEINRVERKGMLLEPTSTELAQFGTNRIRTK